MDTPTSPASDAAFELVGNETRLAILRALWTMPDDTVSFSELRRAAGNPDSGQFNYHLKKLLGTFVQKTDDGYKPLHTGKQLITTILAGTIEDIPEINAVPIDGSCSLCGGGLYMSYQGEEAKVECGPCGKIQMLEEVPPVAFANRSPGDAVYALDRWVLGRAKLMTEGVCPTCASTVKTTVFETRRTRERDYDYVRVRHECSTCSYECDVPIWLYVLIVNHPAVVSFYYEHGIDVTALTAWERTNHGNDSVVEVHSKDPIRVDVTLSLDEDTLRLTLDEQLRVGEVQRDAPLPG